MEFNNNPDVRCFHYHGICGTCIYHISYVSPCIRGQRLWESIPNHQYQARDSLGRCKGTGNCNYKTRSQSPFTSGARHLAGTLCTAGCGLRTAAAGCRLWGARGGCNLDLQCNQLTGPRKNPTLKNFEGILRPLMIFLSVQESSVARNNES